MFSFIDPALDPFPDRSEDPEAFLESQKANPLGLKIMEPAVRKKKKKKKKKKNNGAPPAEDFETVLEEDFYLKVLDYERTETTPLILVALLGLLLLGSK